MTNITKACDFIFNERRLWVDHTLWSRSFIISDVDSFGDKDAVLQRLLKTKMMIETLSNLIMEKKLEIN